VLVCPKCQSEFRAGVDRCNTCDVSLVTPDRLEEEAVGESPRDLLAGKDHAMIPARSLDSAREMVRELVAAGHPAYVDAMHEEGAPVSAGTMQYLVVIDKDEVQEVQQMLEGRYRDMLAREGADHIADHVVDLEAEEVTCPACGHTGALDDEGACADCGLGLGV
jgi:hypothetical protein